jgi:hypothetical protein
MIFFVFILVLDCEDIKMTILLPWGDIIIYCLFHILFYEYYNLYIYTKFRDIFALYCI